MWIPILVPQTRNLPPPEVWGGRCPKILRAQVQGCGATNHSTPQEGTRGAQTVHVENDLHREELKLPVRERTMDEVTTRLKGDLHQPRRQMVDGPTTGG